MNSLKDLLARCLGLKGLTDNTTVFIATALEAGD